ncbi:MAG: GNAT family N-acetyltransferase [Anaerolineae bacterium]|jgi:GNAT superfamily N-acetyltransferase
MNDDGYRLCAHRDLGDMARQLTDLSRRVFGRYDGVLVPSEAHRLWYARRPGMDGMLSTAVVRDGQVVAGAFVTVADVRLGGTLRRTGIIDTVMTHPDHRRRGLARRVLEAAVDGMRARGLEAGLLYTVIDSMPYRLYESLGFRGHTPVCYMRRIQPIATGRDLPVARRADAADALRLRAFMDAHFGGHDGYLPMDEALWRWRKLNRPPELPAQVWYLETGGRVCGCVTLCPAPVVGHDEESWVITDLALEDAGDAPAVGALNALLDAIPAGAEVLTLCPRVERDLLRTLAMCGFEAVGEDEAGMVLPLSPAVESALSTPPPRWYVAVESAIGV